MCIYLFRIVHVTSRRVAIRGRRVRGERKRKKSSTTSQGEKSPNGARHSLNSATNHTREAFRLILKEKFLFIYLFFKNNCLFSAVPTEGKVTWLKNSRLEEPTELRHCENVFRHWFLAIAVVDGGRRNSTCELFFFLVFLLCGFKRWERNAISHLLQHTSPTVHRRSINEDWNTPKKPSAGVLKLRGRFHKRESEEASTWREVDPVLLCEENSNCKRKNNRFRVSPRKLFFPSSFPTALTRLLVFLHCAELWKFSALWAWKCAISINGTEKLKLNRRIFIVLFYFLLLVFFVFHSPPSPGVIWIIR